LEEEEQEKQKIGVKRNTGFVPRTFEDDEEEEKGLDAKMRRTGPIVIDENDEMERPQTGKSKATNFGEKSEIEQNDRGLFGELDFETKKDNMGGKYVG